MILQSVFRIAALCLALTAGMAFAQGVDEPPVPVKTAKPVYPPALKRDGVSGMVSVKITVDETGAVQNPTVVKSTNPAFEQPALDSVSKWKFDPAKKDGKAVSVTVVVPVRFSVD